MYLKESEIEGWLKSRIEKKGGLFIKFTSPGNDGVPDRIVMLPEGRTVFLELKTRYKKLSAVQKYQIRRLLKTGVEVAVIFGPDAAEDFLHDALHFVVIEHAYYGKGETEPLEGIV